MEFLARLSVKDVMVADPVVVAPQQTVQEVVHLMNGRRIGAVLVGENNRIVGIFTERDLLHHAGQAPMGMRQRPVADWMTHNPVTITSTAGWEEAMALMDRLHVRHLPVVDDGKIAGIVSSRDLMARRWEYLNRVVDDRTRELRQVNERLQQRDAELRMHMTVAGRLQARLLPGSPPSWPEIDWAAYYRPLDPLGGDYYDFVQPGERHLGVLIADASGHSIPAAMVAIMARTAFSAAARVTTWPAEVLAAMNANLHGLTEEHFVTAFYGVFDRETHAFTYSNAGQPIPLHYRRRSGTCDPVGDGAAHGLMLGVAPDTQYDEQQIRLEPGDRLLFYTDGVADAVGGTGEAFGAARLAQHLIENADQSATSIAERLADRLAAFRGQRPAQDDVTILAAAIRADAG